MDYYDYINRVNTDYDDYDKKWEIEDSWKELNKLPEIQRGFVTNLVNGTIRKFE